MTVFLYLVTLLAPDTCIYSKLLKLDVPIYLPSLSTPHCLCRHHHCPISSIKNKKKIKHTFQPSQPKSSNLVATTSVPMSTRMGHAWVNARKHSMFVMTTAHGDQTEPLSHDTRQHRLAWNDRGGTHQQNVKLLDIA